MKDEIQGAEGERCVEERESGFNRKVLGKDVKNVEYQGVHEKDAEPQGEHNDRSKEEFQNRLHEEVQEREHSGDHGDIPKTGA